VATTSSNTKMAKGLPLPATATLGALGIVYGDIGTSPLYAFKEAIKAATASGAPVADAVLGVVSLIIWSLILIISLKYAILIMRADNRGEGGIVALLALLRARHARPGTWRAGVLMLGLLGRGAALWRRRDHSRHLGVERGRRPQG
jgi:KUP system potassium uptake protein